MKKDGRVNQSLNKTGDKGGIHSTSSRGDVKVGGQIKPSSKYRCTISIRNRW